MLRTNLKNILIYCEKNVIWGFPCKKYFETKYHRKIIWYFWLWISVCLIIARHLVIFPVLISPVFLRVFSHSSKSSPVLRLTSDNNEKSVGIFYIYIEYYTFMIDVSPSITDSPKSLRHRFQSRLQGRTFSRYSVFIVITFSSIDVSGRRGGGSGELVHFLCRRNWMLARKFNAIDASVSYPRSRHSVGDISADSVCGRW